MQLDELPFDRLHVDGHDLSLEDFMALPSSERIRHLLAGEIEFSRHGIVVDTNEALAVLRAHLAVRA